MKAYTYSRYGNPEVLELVDVATPIPNDNEILIKTHATTVSSGDWRARSLKVPAGMGWMARLAFGVFRPRKPILGTELSGVVVEVGAAVTEFKVGDAVIAFPGASFGAHAEYCVMPQDGKVAHKPETLSFEAAAALAFGGTTAYDFLVNKAQVKAGEKVLVNGASGATGTSFVQLAKFFGAEITAVCSAANAELVRSLGADHVFDYAKTDFADGGHKFDVIVDTAGTAPWSRSRRALTAGGRLVIVNGSLLDMVLGPLRARLSGKKMIVGVASEAASILRKLVSLADEGHFIPVIDRSYSFDHMIDAHRHVDTGHKKGNVVVVLVPSKREPGEGERLAS
ncbi:Quinone oxidoreductase 1 [Flavimaricola marinus]|uniref:Quinone oxidoreductase 1 n=2 Tax=Flavimaricola marinus TaxID=1819565 RepID=A0A238LHT1_9RHOB|nr:Quinone oxidoreductase 1 [Flavimaricola marinus]